MNPYLTAQSPLTWHDTEEFHDTLVLHLGVAIRIVAEPSRGKTWTQVAKLVNK